MCIVTKPIGTPPHLVIVEYCFPLQPKHRIESSISTATKSLLMHGILEDVSVLLPVSHEHNFGGESTAHMTLHSESSLPIHKSCLRL